MSNLANKKLINQTYQECSESFSSYPADEYTLKVAFFKDATNKFTLTAIAEGTDHLIKFDPTVAGYKDKTHGQYKYQMTAVKGDQTYPIENGIILIAPNLEKDTDPRTYWTKIYEQLKTAYDKLSNKESDSVNVLGMQVTYAKRDDLLAKLLDAEQRMNAEIGSPKSKSRIFKSRFRIN